MAQPRWQVGRANTYHAKMTRTVAKPTMLLLELIAPTNSCHGRLQALGLPLVASALLLHELLTVARASTSRGAGPHEESRGGGDAPFDSE